MLTGIQHAAALTLPRELVFPPERLGGWRGGVRWPGAGMLGMGLEGNGAQNVMTEARFPLCSVPDQGPDQAPGLKAHTHAQREWPRESRSEGWSWTNSPAGHWRDTLSSQQIYVDMLEPPAEGRPKNSFFLLKGVFIAIFES